MPISFGSFAISQPPMKSRQDSHYVFGCQCAFERSPCEGLLRLIWPLEAIVVGHFYLTGRDWYPLVDHEAKQPCACSHVRLEPWHIRQHDRSGPCLQSID